VTREIWLIRHGESDSNAGLPTTHPKLSALTPRGLAEAEAVAGVFPRPPDRIILSAYDRATQTAAPTLRRFPDRVPETWPVHEFTYLAPARYRARTKHDRLPHITAYWERCDPQYCDGEGAESFAALCARVARAWERLRALPDAFTAVFTHGAFSQALVWCLLHDTFAATPQTMAHFRGFHLGFWIPNGAIVPLHLPTDDSVWVGPIRRLA
jgi:broad specificity phosphatase PhoE